MNDSTGAAQLAGLMQARMKSVYGSPIYVDTGVIQPNYDLLTNSFPKPISVTQYWVCRIITHDPKLPLTETFVNEDPEHKHIHKVKLPRKMWRIQPGDHVLVVWHGSDAIIVDVIYPGTEVLT